MTLPAPRPHLTFPVNASDLLSGLTRPAQLHAAALLSHAGNHLSNRPQADFNACAETQTCLTPAMAPPRRSGSAPSLSTPLCLLCAVDVAVERMSNGFTSAFQRELTHTGTAAKQAVIWVLEENPGAAVSQAVIVVASRLHQGNLNAQTAHEIREQADLALCHRWLEHTNYRGAIPNLPTAVAAMLTARGWMAGDVVTPPGKFAHEQYKRDARRAASLRPAR